MLARRGADFICNIAELAASFGTHSAEPCVLLACSCDDEDVIRVENGHGFRIDETVGVKYGQAFGRWSQPRLSEPDRLAGVDKDIAIDFVANFCREVDKAEGR